MNISLPWLGGVEKEVWTGSSQTSLRQNYLEGFVKTHIVGPTPTLWFSRSGVKSSISAKFQGDASDAGLGSLLWETQVSANLVPYAVT